MRGKITKTMLKISPYCTKILIYFNKKAIIEAFQLKMLPICPYFPLLNEKGFAGLGCPSKHSK
jgi:hypothetical protein